MGKKIKIGIIQVNTERCNIEKNANKAIDLIKEAHQKGAQIVCTSECMLDGYGFDSEEFKAHPEKYAFTAKSEIVQRFFDLAKELGIYLALGLSLKAPKHDPTDSNKRENTNESSPYRNCVLLVGPDGKERGKYYKIHSTFQNYEADFYEHGTETPVFNLDLNNSPVKVGFMICYDRQMPETARMLKIKGAEIIFNPVATGNFKSRWFPHWNTRLMRTRAYENDVFIVSVNHAAPRLTGHSLVVDPKGKRIKTLSRWQQAKVVEINLNKIEDSGHHLYTRRPSVYSSLLEDSKYE